MGTANMLFRLGCETPSGMTQRSAAKAKEQLEAVAAYLKKLFDDLDLEIFMPAGDTCT